MSIVVNHDKRQKMILKKSMKLFAEYGYSDVTYQKIADKCGVARTTLYKYFQNKREVFDATIREVTVVLEHRYFEIMNTAGLNYEDRLRQMIYSIVDNVFDQKVILGVILDYLLSLRRSGNEVSRKVRRHTIKVRLLFREIIMGGINSGEFKKLNVRVVNDALYSLCEAVIFKVTVAEINYVTKEKCYDIVDLFIDGIKNDLPVDN
ncbi:MAG: TetR/AcrR family transcriptional regulator [Kiritimatiellae bacterium]|jgi:AcrR family transcriptional regulator|nr:TetR/AcrR family transcriptional regulator [Kiritimatiellia bacterium]